MPPATRRATVDSFDSVLGLRLIDWPTDKVIIPANVASLAEQRERARAEKDWVQADRLRDTLNTLGWQVEDSKSGQRLSRTAKEFLPTRDGLL